MRILLLVFLLFLPQPSWAEGLKDAIQDMSANVVFMRHALAPGYGDPANFKIGDCSTQRNLDHVGREQARALGQALRQEGIGFSKILSSEWCRCLDTAQELGLGPWQRFPGLNSFFEGHADRQKTLALLKSELARLGPDELVLMVTHQVVIRAVTGSSVESGGIVLYNTATGTSRQIGVLAQ